jgi:glycosyltransferase involved in cell wall biosynthesis
MKVLHLNYARGDGAGNAVERLHTALVQSGIESRFMYLRPHTSLDSPLSIFEKKMNGLENRLVVPFTGGKLVNGYPSLNVFPTKVLTAVNHSEADVLHLHWINGEMLSIAQVARITKPIVWTFHSMWPFLGMHHWDVSKELDACRKRVDRWTFDRKLKHWKDLKCHVICPSSWMAERASESELFRRHPVTVIPNCLDTSVFKPMDMQIKLRGRFGLPENKQILLFGATQPGALRKGGDLIGPIVKRYADAGEVILAIFGTKQKRVVTAGESEYGLETHELGFIRDEAVMAELYNAADVVCIPSRQDNLPSVCLEAKACGRPVVAFNIGGLSDMIKHRESGYLAREQDVFDFQEGITWALSFSEVQLKENRNRIATQFSMERVARLHAEHYRKVLADD